MLLLMAYCVPPNMATVRSKFPSFCCNSSKQYCSVFSAVTKNPLSRKDCICFRYRRAACCKFCTVSPVPLGWWGIKLILSVPLLLLLPLPLLLPPPPITLVILSPIPRILALARSEAMRNKRVESCLRTVISVFTSSIESSIFALRLAEKVFHRPLIRSTATCFRVCCAVVVSVDATVGSSSSSPSFLRPLLLPSNDNRCAANVAVVAALASCIDWRADNRASCNLLVIEAMDNFANGFVVVPLLSRREASASPMLLLVCCCCCCCSFCF